VAPPWRRAAKPKRRLQKRRARSTSPAPASRQVAVTDEDRARKRRRTLSKLGGESEHDTSGHAVLGPRQDSDGDALPAAYLLERIKGLLPRLSKVAAQRVRPPTQQSYILALEDLCHFIGRCGKKNDALELPAWNAQTWDPVLVDYLESRYDLGRAKEACTRTVYALLWGDPSVGSHVRSSLPRTHALLQGWQKLEPSQSRPPLPRVVALAIATQMVKNGKGMHGLCVYTMVATYMRPNEACSLKNFQLVRGDDSAPLGSHLRDFTFVLHPEELLNPSKTGIVDCNITLDLKEHQTLSQCWDWVADFYSHAPMANTFSFTYKTLLECFKNTCIELGVDVLQPTPHALRHGGASWDFAAKNRDLDGIQKRGLWQSAQSVARYSKSGRIGIQLSKLGSRVRRKCQELEKECDSTFRDDFAKHYVADD
jgi:hypothetical protein